jgi:hypothetical protein
MNYSFFIVNNISMTSKQIDSDKVKDQLCAAYTALASACDAAYAARDAAHKAADAAFNAAKAQAQADYEAAVYKLTFIKL